MSGLHLSDTTTPLGWQSRNGGDIVVSTTIRFRAERRRPIDTMLAKGVITQHQWEAGDRFYRDWALGPIGARDVDEGENVLGIRGAGGIQGYAAAQLDALRDHRRAVRALGPRLLAFVGPCICADSTAADLARVLKMDSRAVLAILILGFDTLADFYD